MIQSWLALQYLLWWRRTTMAAILFSPPEDIFGTSTPGVPLKSRLNAKRNAKAVLHLVKLSHIHLIEGRKSFFAAFAILTLSLLYLCVLMGSIYRNLRKQIRTQKVVGR